MYICDVVWKQLLITLLKNLFTARLPAQSLGVFALKKLMRKLFQCNESESDFMEILKSSENTIYFDLDPLLTNTINNTIYLTFDDCRELVKELNFLMDKLG